MLILSNVRNVIKSFLLIIFINIFNYAKGKSIKMHFKIKNLLKKLWKQ